MKFNDPKNSLACMRLIRDFNNRNVIVGSNDTLKTAKIAIDAENMSLDGAQDTRVRKPKKKERQKGKKVIKEQLAEMQKKDD